MESLSDGLEMSNPTVEIPKTWETLFSQALIDIGLPSDQDAGPTLMPGL